MSFSPPVTSTACLDAWTSRQAAGGSQYEYPYLASDMARLRILVAVAAGNEFTIPAGQEVFSFQVRIDHAHTTGTPTCAGCNTPVCIGWGRARVTRVPPLEYVQILGSATPNHGSNVTWQPGAVATTVGSCRPQRPCESYVLCQSVTPTQRGTWGSIKSLYR